MAEHRYKWEHRCFTHNKMPQGDISLSDVHFLVTDYGVEEPNSEEKLNKEILARLFWPGSNQRDVEVTEACK